MKQNLEKVVGYTLAATDEEIGKVDEVYFEDDTWVIRYLVIETAGLFSGRKVLISPQTVLNVDVNKEALIVRLTSEQIINSPDIDTEKPIYRQQEIALSSHYGWPNYWAGALWGAGMGTTGMIVGNRLPLTDAIKSEKYIENEQEETNLHLRSSKKIKGYKIQTLDGEVGEVEDFIIDTNEWSIDFLIVDTGNRLAPKKVLIPCDLITQIKWETSTVVVACSAYSIKNSPAYMNERVTEAYAAAWHRHFEQAG